MFYYEYKMPDGRWAPALADERPKEKDIDGTTRKLNNVQELPEQLIGSPLSELHEFFNREGQS